jgi:hypothetical protein
MNALFSEDTTLKVRRYLLSRPYADEIPGVGKALSLRELISYVTEHGSDADVDGLHDILVKPLFGANGYSEAEVERKNNMEQADLDFGVHGAALEPQVPPQPQPWVARGGTEQAKTATDEWVSGLGPAILVLSGPPGAGKTHLAIEAANAVLDRGVAVAYRTEADMMSEIRRAPDHGLSQDDVADAFASHPWLILDDFGVEVPSEKWGKAIQDRIINGRWIWAEGGMVRTLVTTNLRSADLADRGRIASRLLDRTRSRQVQLRVSDWRLGAVDDK